MAGKRRHFTGSMPLDRLRDAGMNPAAAESRQAAVERVADQLVGESDTPRVRLIHQSSDKPGLNGVGEYIVADVGYLESARLPWSPSR